MYTLILCIVSQNVSLYKAKQRNNSKKSKQSINPISSDSKRTQWKTEFRNRIQASTKNGLPFGPHSSADLFDFLFLLELSFISSQFRICTNTTTTMSKSSEIKDNKKQSFTDIMTRTDSESPPAKRTQLGLHYNEVNNNTVTRTTIHELDEGEVGLSLAMLGGNGHFRYAPLACKMFLRTSKLNTYFKKITTGESVTSSVSCAKKYFEDEGTGKDKLEFFWDNAARYGRVDVMEWARQQGYHQHVYVDLEKFSYIGKNTCRRAAECGKLQALQWFRENECDWDESTYEAAAENGHLSVLQWAKEN